jgi:hypothetical protein
MRSREEIEYDADNAGGPHKSDAILELILEVMLDSREVLHTIEFKLTKDTL